MFKHVLPVYFNINLFQLSKLGFTNIDALDGSEEMLNKAKEKNVFKKCILSFLTPNEPLDIESSKNNT